MNDLDELRRNAMDRLGKFWTELEHLETAGVVPHGIRDLCEEHERAAMLLAAVMLDGSNEGRFPAVR